MNIVEFLIARITEDEAAAHAASPGGWQYGTVESVAGGTLYDESRSIADLTYEQIEDHDGTIVRHLLSDEANANGAHIARHDPARMLAECRAKRAIINLHDQTGERWTGFPRADQQEHYCIHDQQPAPCPTLRVLASVYADHSDYREEWGQ